MAEGKSAGVALGQESALEAVIAVTHHRVRSMRG